MLRIEWTSDGGATEAVEFDCTHHEVYEAPNAITDHVVERGAPMTDHVRPEAETLKLEAVVSNTVARTSLSFLDGATVAPGQVALPGGGSITALKLSRPVDRVRIAAGVLYDLRTNGTVLTVRSPRIFLPDVVIERVNFDWNSGEGGALPLTLDLRRVRFAVSETVPVDAPTTRRQQRTQQRGAQPTTPATPEERRRSMLVQAGRAFGISLPGDG
jgi:hypothetical protein